MDEEIYDKLSLRAYIAASAGFNAANVDEATKYNVVVSNAKGYCKEEVAIHSIMFILDFARKQHIMVPYVKQGNWGLSIAGSIKRFSKSTVGILGLGSIGGTVAKILSGFGVKIISCDPNVSEEKMAGLGVGKVDFETLINQSDFLTIHTPLTKDTKGIINLEIMKKMKPTSYIINTARGSIIKQEDLYHALTHGIIAGAGLDVIEHEPPMDSDRKLIELPNVLVTPHSAYLSEEASEAQLRITAEEVGRILRNETPLNLVNPEILTKLTWLEKN
jgi:D-3-phosphoglycerate dehydrogenase